MSALFELRRKEIHIFLILVVLVAISSYPLYAQETIQKFTIIYTGGLMGEIEPYG
jgi:hypothetical protein